MQFNNQAHEASESETYLLLLFFFPLSSSSPSQYNVKSHGIFTETGGLEISTPVQFFSLCNSEATGGDESS